MSMQPTNNPPEKKNITVEMSDPKAPPIPGNGEKKPELKSVAPPPPSVKKAEPEDLPKVGTTFSLKLSEILVKPGENARIKFNATTLNQMAETLKNIGQIQALSVYWEDGKWYLVAGERRLRAAKIAGIAKLECKRIPTNRGAIIATRIIENGQRDNLYYYEDALDYKKALGQQVLDPKTKKMIAVTQKWIAENAGKTEGYVSQRLSCLEMAQEIQDKMREGKVSITVARELWGEKNPEKQLELFRKSLTETGEIDKKSVKSAAERLRAEKAKAKREKGEKRLGRPPLSDTGELPDVARQGLDEANERLRHFKLELRKKEEMRNSISTVYERFINSRSEEKKTYLKGMMAGMEYAVSIRKDL